MTNRRTLLLAGCGLLCLLVVASALPAADPRLEVPGSSDEPASTPADTDNGTTERTTPPDDEALIQVDEPLVPGTIGEIDLDPGDDISNISNIPIEVDGELVGDTDRTGDASFSVPYREEITITAVQTASQTDADITRTVDVQTGARILIDKPVIPGDRISLEATVGETLLSDAAVYQDGERVDTTNQRGEAVLEPQQEPGETVLRVERGAVTGDRTVEVADPSVKLDSPLLFPGSFASVTVTADGQPVDNADIIVNGDRVAQTDEDGKASIRLPLANRATVTAEAGSVTRTTSAGNLYFRLTTIVVLVPGLIIGSLWAVGRFLAIVEFEFELPDSKSTDHTASSPESTSLFLVLGDALAGLASAFGGLFSGIAAVFAHPFGGSGGRGFSWPSVPRVGLPFSLPALSLPSFEGVRLSLSRSSDPILGDWFRSEEPSSGHGQQILDEESEPSGERAEMRAIWGAFLDQLEIDEPETRTAGEVARHAVASGFPAASVRQLVATFRDVEYGGRDASIDRVTTARAALLDLQANDPQEGTE